MKDWLSTVALFSLPEIEPGSLDLQTNTLPHRKAMKCIIYLDPVTQSYLRGLAFTL